MKSIFELEWEDKHGDWLTEDFLNKHLEKNTSKKVVVHKLYDVGGTINGNKIFKNEFRLVKKWATGE
jgi:hypothetical protein